MTTALRVRRAAAAGGCAITAGIGTLAGVGAAQAQTASAGTAPPAGAAATQGSGKPMRVHADAGTFAPFSYEGCNAGYFCVSGYPPVWFSILSNATLYGGAYSLPYGECSPILEAGCDNGIHSWANNTGDRVWLKATPTGGKELCISNHTHNFDYNGIADNDYWIQVTSNPNPCP